MAKLHMKNDMKLVDRFLFHCVMSSSCGEIQEEWCLVLTSIGL